MEDLRDKSKTGSQEKTRPNIIPSNFLNRFMDLTPTHFLASVTVLSLLMSDFGMVMFRYIDTRDLSRAFDLPIYQAGTVTLPNWLNILSSIIFFFLFLYTFYFIKSSRSLAIEAGKDLGPLLPKNGPSYTEILGRHKNDYLYFILLGVFFAIPFSSYFIVNFQYSTGIFSLVHATISTFLEILVIATVVWVYFKILKGLYDIGKQSLNLKPFYEDSMYGTGQAGKLSLTVTAYYFLMVVILSLALATSIFQTLGSQLGAVLLSFVGGSLFFLSLRSFHARMVKQKQVDKEKIRLNFTPVLESISQGSSSQKSINDLWDLNALEMIQQKVTAAHTWPFDVGIVVRIVTLTGLPILVSVMARLLLNILHI